MVNDPTTISRNAKPISINGAPSGPDLYGQVVADSIDGRQVSGVGGHEDFVAGADWLDAHSLICLRSTVEVGGGTPFTPRREAAQGSIVSTPRHHTGVVVASSLIRGGRAARADGRERAHALVDIAHPDHREELRIVAESLGTR